MDLGKQNLRAEGCLNYGSKTPIQMLLVKKIIFHK